MNLIQKIKQYFQLRSQCLSHKTASECFKLPLTESDIISIVLTIALALLILTLIYKDEIDGERVAVNTKANQLAIQAKNARATAKRNENLLVSMLNGAVYVDGKLTTICRLKASGDCYE